MGLTKGIVMLLTPEQQEEIDQLRSNPQLTLRAVAPGMEEHLYSAKPVLDHGFVRVIDYMGDDAARQAWKNIFTVPSLFWTTGLCG